MMKRFTMTTAACLLMGVSAAFAQNTKVTGHVVDENGDPVIGASVVVKGTTIGTVTDFDGNFTLDVPSQHKHLEISYVGMKSRQFNVSSKINAVLESDTQNLDEVMVVAYGTAKKSAFTGSAATISNEKIAKRQTSNVTNALTGQVAGVQTTSNTGQPGKDATIRVRGIGSMAASNRPLYVVDGVPYDGEISAISTSDIESMTVLKDAASNALYGARGANGVILITTRKGKSGEARVNFDAKWGVNKRGVPSYETISDPGQFYELNYEAIYNGDLKKYMANGDLAAANAYANDAMLSKSYLGYLVYTLPNGEKLIGMDGKLNPNAKLGYSDGTNYFIPDNWSDELFETNPRQEYNLNVSGASDKMNYYMSAGYLNDKGIVPESGFKRYTARLKADYQVKPWLKLSGNMSYTHYDSREQDTEGNTSNGNAFYAANIVGAIYPMYIRDASGNIMKDNRGFTRYDYGADTNFKRENVIPNGNPLASYILDKRSYSGDVFSGKWGADIDLWGGIKAKINIGVDNNNIQYRSVTNPYYGQYSETSGVGGIIYASTQRVFSVNQQYLLTWNKTFNDVHNLDILAGHENYNYRFSYLYGKREKIYNPDIYELDNAILNQNNSSFSQTYATEGWLFRAQYDYDSKYFGSASFRRDASSVFHPDHRWGNFWSFGAGWLMNKESFLENQSWIDMLKFKISYGMQGNDALLYEGSTSRNYVPYKDQYALSNSNGDFSTSLTYKGNEKITWETSHSFNTGFDFNFWGGKLSGSAEYFSRKTTDMLYFKPVAASMGYSRYPENIGSMINRGVEVDLHSNLIETKDFTWDINLNLTHVKNKINELAPELKGELIDGSRIYREGESMYQLYLPKFVGVDPETGESMWALKEPNDKGETTTKSYTTAASNRFATGDILPKVYGGFGTSVTAYGFDFSLSFAYQLGGRIWDYTYQDLMSGQSKGAALHVDMLNRWTPNNKNTDVPRRNIQDQAATNYSSDRWLTSSNYLSLQNITFGYTLPKTLTRKIQIDGIRVYFVADNVALLTARKGMDPRQSYTNAQNVYSPIRTISGGISLNF